jgi:hypothetical protein
MAEVAKMAQKWWLDHMRSQPATKIKAHRKILYITA